MIRNYRLGDYESLDMTITDAGSDQIKLRYDGLEGCAFSDLELYSDSGRTTALSVSDWEYYTEDTGKTAKELESGGTSKTIYKEIRILNPTYQTGSIYATFNNFGTYPDGSVLGIDYIEISANYAYTTQRNLMTYLVCDGLSSDITITVTDAGFDERSQFNIENKDSTYDVNIVHSAASETYVITPSQAQTFYSSPTAMDTTIGSKQICKAWVNFNGTGTVAIRDSFNVSSITRNGTGNYTINFTNPMKDTNYCVFTGVGKGEIGIDDNIQGSARLAPITSTTSQQIAVSQAGGGSLIDADYINLVVFGL